MKLLDLFCGIGGWSHTFYKYSWECTGVDIKDHAYPYNFIKSDVLSLSQDFIDSFDAVVMSPPCEDFARAWLPWLRFDKKPDDFSIYLLKWSVQLAQKPLRLVECSKFSSRHVPGSLLFGSYALWGDIPILMPPIPAGKTKKSGTNPAKRAEIPFPLAYTVCEHFTKNLTGNIPQLRI